MSQKTILYVEDNEFNRKIVRQLLAKTKYKLREAHDGESAVKDALQDPPDLILMDVQLPKMSGLDATRQLRAEKKTAAIPARTIKCHLRSSIAPSRQQMSTAEREVCRSVMSARAAVWFAMRTPSGSRNIAICAIT